MKFTPPSPDTPTLIGCHRALPTFSVRYTPPSHVLKPSSFMLLCLIHSHENNVQLWQRPRPEVVPVLCAPSRAIACPKLVRAQARLSTPKHAQAPVDCLAADLVLLGGAQGVTSTDRHQHSTWKTVGLDSMIPHILSARCLEYSNNGILHQILIHLELLDCAPLTNSTVHAEAGCVSWLHWLLLGTGACAPAWR